MADGGMAGGRGERVTVCLCSHEPDEHTSTHGCLATVRDNYGYPEFCRCATYEHDERPEETR